MSLRVRLFVLLGGLVALFGLAQWWLVRTLTGDISGEVGHVAFQVGESVVDTFAWQSREENAFRAAPPASGELRRRFVLRGLPKEDGDLVQESTVRLAEVDGHMQVVEQVVFVGRLPPGSEAVDVEQEHEAAEPDAPPADVARPEHVDALLAHLREATGRDPEGGDITGVVELSLDSPVSAAFLKLSGPNLERHIPIPRSGLEEALETFRSHLLLGSLALVAVGLVAAGLVAHRAAAPLRELSSAAAAVGGGALGTQVEPRGGGEVAEAIQSFNRMSTKLQELDADARALRAREHLSELGEIARGLAHGLRNPLNALGLSIEQLARDLEEAGQDRSELARTARRQIARIDASIRSFLALSAAGGDAPDQPVDLVAVAEDVVLEVLQDCGGGVSIRVEPGEHVPAVTGLEPELRAAVQALVVNAVEASPPDGEVLVRVAASDHGAVVEVEDDGPGLPEKVRRDLFTPHVTTKSTGAGMGLYLAHRIATVRHGGRLELQDREPCGTRAVLEVPARG